MSKPVVVRSGEKTPFSFGDLLVTAYFETDKIAFGTALLPAGGKGLVDAGHEGSEEVIYVTSGTLIYRFDDTGDEAELSAGDAVLVPPSRPHALENRSSKDATITYSCAPKL